MWTCDVCFGFDVGATLAWVGVLLRLITGFELLFLLICIVYLFVMFVLLAYCFAIACLVCCEDLFRLV